MDGDSVEAACETEAGGVGEGKESLLVTESMSVKLPVVMSAENWRV